MARSADFPDRRYTRGIRQAEIAAQLDLSQATLSRLLKRAEDEQIARITVGVPYGAFTELEEGLDLLRPWRCR